MGIKRGVSLYSYQQAQFFKQMDWKAQIKHVHDVLKCDGIEIIDEAVIPGYPFPSDAFVASFRNEIARYNMKAVTMDIYLDVMQFRDHVMNHAEVAERLRHDIILASKLGFANVRCLCAMPIDSIEMCLETAEKYNVRIGKEIHRPFPIAPKKQEELDPMTAAMGSGRMCDEIVELAQKTGSKFVGLVPDFGIFQHKEPQIELAYRRRHTEYPKAFDWVLANRGKLSYEELKAKAEELEPGCISQHTIGFETIDRLCLGCQPSAKPEELKAICKYIVSIHGKFYDMKEIPGQPGHYEEPTIDYPGAIKALKEAGYDGYIDSEYEGQRDQQDQGMDKLPDECEQLRRHHEMLTRLIGA
jgi:sugar phosphate isomerase/epimerase